MSTDLSPASQKLLREIAKYDTGGGVLFRHAPAAEPPHHRHHRTDRSHHMTSDPRIVQLAEARYRNGYGATAADAWDTLDASLRQHLTNEAAAWLRAAVEAGLMPPADRPTPDHDAVLLDNHGQLWGEYQTSPPSHGDAILRLVWASEQCSSKQEIQAEGGEFRLIGWSE
jgi:uncharacterized glyoxalase superfamily protein PhnB